MSNKSEYQGNLYTIDTTCGLIDNL